jgi:hypothetical protein
MRIFSSDEILRWVFEVSDNDAFWSITVYGDDGIMKSDNNIFNQSNVKYNDDGTLTVHYRSKEACGEVPNQVDASEGWNILTRIYRPGKSVIDGDYKLPEAKPAS